MRWNTFANILSNLSIPFSMAFGAPAGGRLRRSRGRAGRTAYIDALESRQLLSGSPLVTDFSKTLDENSVLAFSQTDFTSNYSDPNNAPLVSVQFEALPHLGTLTLTQGLNTTPLTTNQIVVLSDLDGLKYTPDNGSSGTDAFVWSGFNGTSASDNTANGTLNVEQPTISGIAKNVQVNNTLTFAGADFTGTYSGLFPIASITVLTLPTQGALQLSGNAVVANQIIDVSQLGNITFVPTANFVGNDSFTWSASDGTASSTSQTVSIAIASDLTDISRSIAVNNPLSFVGGDITGAYTGPNSVQTVTVLTVPAHGTLKLTINSSTTSVTANQVIAIANLGGLVYTPTANYVGGDLFTWQASDGNVASNAGQVNLTVNADLTGIFKTILQNNTLSFLPTDITNNYSGVNPVQTVRFVSLPGSGTLTITENATTSIITTNETLSLAEIADVIYTPTNNFVGSDAFTWIASDGTFASNVTTVNITVTSPFTAFAKSIDQGTTATFTAGDFTGAFSPSLQSVEILRIPTRGTLTLTVGQTTTKVTQGEVIPVGELGGLVYRPPATFTGSDSILWSGSSSSTNFANPGSVIALTVTALDVSDFSKTAGEGTPFNFQGSDFATNFTGGSALATVKIVSLPTHGTLSLTSGTNSGAVTANQIILASDLGGLVYTSASNYVGADSFKWDGADGGVYATAPAAVNLNVAALTVTGNGISILNGDSTPSTDDFTNFASTATVGPAITRTFIVTNITNQTINFTGAGSLVQLTGGTASEFTVTNAPATTLAPNATTSFTITFTPTHATVINNTVTIPFTAATNGTFTFSIDGTGLIGNIVDASTNGNLLSTTTVAGKGTGAFNGEILHISYVGRLLDGTIFDQTSAHNNIPLAFRLDNTAGQSFLTGNTTNTFVDFAVIQGWEDAIQGMKVGEHRTLIIPSEFGYGSQGSGSSIPPDATLIFDIVLNAVDGSPSLGITNTTNQTAILPGDTTPNTGDGTDFGTLSATQTSVTSSFTGTNNSPDAAGGLPLGQINPSNIKITGADPKDFIFTGNLQSFALTFKPLAPGVRTATVNITTDDPLHKTFSFAVKGNSVAFNDLIVQVVGPGSFPTVAGTDGSLTTTIPIILQNIGNTPVSSITPTTDVKISLMNTADTTSTPIVIGTVPVVNVGGLGVGGTKTVNVPVTIPGGLTLSTYTYIAEVDSSDSIAQSVTSNDTLNIAQNVSGTLVSTSIPSLIVDANPLKGNVVVTVKNSGALAFTPTEKVQITIQAVNGATVINVATGSSFSVGSLKAGGTMDFTIPVNFVAGITDGSYTLQAVLALTPRAYESSISDNTVTVNASNTNLTVVSAPADADLTTSFGSTRFPVAGGGNGNFATSIPVIITNEGNIPVPNASGNTDVRVFLHNINDTTSADILVGERLHVGFGGLAQNKSQAVDVPISVSGTISAANYVYLAQVNASLAVPESDTTNNSGTASMNIGGTLVSSTLPASVAHAAKPTSGTVNVTLQNLGTLTLPSDMVVKVQIFAHNVNSNVDTLLDAGARTITTGRWNQTGGSFTFAFVVKLPSQLPAGNYILEANLVDVPAIRESNITDNLVTQTQFLSTIPLTIT